MTCNHLKNILLFTSFGIMIIWGVFCLFLQSSLITLLWVLRLFSAVMPSADFSISGSIPIKQSMDKAYLGWSYSPPLLSIINVDLAGAKPLSSIWWPGVAKTLIFILIYQLDFVKQVAEVSLSKANLILLACPARTLTAINAILELPLAVLIVLLISTMS